MFEQPPLGQKEALNFLQANPTGVIQLVPGQRGQSGLIQLHVLGENPGDPYLVAQVEGFRNRLAVLEGVHQLAGGLEEVTQLERPIEAGVAQQEKTGYVVDAGVGLLVSRLRLNAPYLVVAEGIEQAQALRNAGVQAGNIVALVATPHEKSELIQRQFPGDNILVAEGLDKAQAQRYAWQTASDWLRELKKVEVVPVRTTARTVQGLLAQLKELLPLQWQQSLGVTDEDAEQVLRLYQLGV